MPRFLPLASLLLILAVSACDSSSEADLFVLTLSDVDREAVYTGELRLTIESVGPADEPGAVTGRWQLEGAGARPDPTPNSGLVVGTISEGQVEINLEVDASDSGFSLSGVYLGDRISGAWFTITIGGPIPGGTFVAVRE